jgi:hypothetical protein
MVWSEKAARYPISTRGPAAPRTPRFGLIGRRGNAPIQLLNPRSLVDLFGASGNDSNLK